MCKMQHMLALVALCVGLAHSFSWDFATASGIQLEFYFNGRQLHTENITSGDIEVITYDAVGKIMFFVDRVNTNTAIFSYDITTKKTESLVLKSGERERIAGIDFDPVEEIIFWIEKYSCSIRWFSIKPGFKNNVYGNLLIEMFDKSLTIYAIAVDSCRGYIYWTSTDLDQNKLPSTIERARFDGSEREVIIGSNLQNPRRLALDQQTQKLYWIDGLVHNEPTKDSQFSIESADLNGQNRTLLYSEKEIEQPVVLTVSKDSIYWVHFFQRTVKQLPKDPSIHAKPKEILVSTWGEITTNYKIEDQIQGIQGCEALKSLISNNSVTDNNVSVNISSDVSHFCVHGMNVSGKSQCECLHGYTGEGCDVPAVCQNYCFQGVCIVSAEEQPTCRCNAGYSGKRCEVNICQGYCLNDGICSMNEENEPVCQCKGHYEGERCDFSTCLNKCFQKVVSMVWGVINTDVTRATLDKEVRSTCASPAD